MYRAAGIDRTPGVDRAGERGDGGNVVHAATWWAFVAVMMAIVWELNSFLTLIKEVKGNLLWLSSFFKRVPTDESTNGGCYPVDPTKWAFIVPFMLICAITGIYIGYAARAEIERAQESLQRVSSDVFRRGRVYAEEILQRAFSHVFQFVGIAVNSFRNIDLPAFEAVELES